MWMVGCARDAEQPSGVAHDPMSADQHPVVAEHGVPSSLRADHARRVKQAHLFLPRRQARKAPAGGIGLSYEQLLPVQDWRTC